MAAENSPPNPRYFGLLGRRSLLLPTLRGWALLLLAALLGVVLIGRGLYRFLSVYEPAPEGGLLVVQGWGPDHNLEMAIQEFYRRPHLGVYVTGGPIEQGTHLSEYKTFAQAGAATLLKIGFDRRFLHAVPPPPAMRDRNFVEAIALKRWCLENHVPIQTLNIITLGAHARRSRLVFEKAFGPGTRVGVLAIEDSAFDPARWWASSQGVRSVVDETVAYFYARFLFHPPAEEATGQY